MTPTIDERLASIVRSMTEVILPHLPPEASLAQEQVHLAIGHLQILRSQIDAMPAFEQGEHDDALAIGAALVSAITGGSSTAAAVQGLHAAMDAPVQGHIRDKTVAINRAVDVLVKAVAADGSPEAGQLLAQIILDHEQRRVHKDRQWFLPYGFDSMAGAA